jgi:hypothetical protein
MAKQYTKEIDTITKIASSLEAEGRKFGKGRRKGWFQRIQVGTVPQRGGLGKFALIEKLMKRVGFGDRYSEKIVDRDTGEVLRVCEEPLSQHQGHGSAKLKPRK